MPGTEEKKRNTAEPVLEEFLVKLGQRNGRHINFLCVSTEGSIGWW